MPLRLLDKLEIIMTAEIERRPYRQAHDDKRVEADAKRAYDAADAKSQAARAAAQNRSTRPINGSNTTPAARTVRGGLRETLNDRPQPDL